MLKTYNTTNTHHKSMAHNGRDMTLAVTGGGVVTISRAAAQALGLPETGGMVVLIGDDKAADVLYVRKTTDNSGFRFQPSGRKVLRCVNSGIRDLLVAASGKDASYMRFRLDRPFREDPAIAGALAVNVRTVETADWKDRNAFGRKSKKGGAK